jgi:hypothetical protein
VREYRVDRAVAQLDPRISVISGILHFQVKRGAVGSEPKAVATNRDLRSQPARFPNFELKRNGRFDWMTQYPLNKMCPDLPQAPPNPVCQVLLSVTNQQVG